MKSTDKPAFALALTGCLVEIYDKAVSPALLEVWCNALLPYELADVHAALTAHISDPQRGQFPPKPADIIRHLPTTATDDGHPGPDEAWGLLVRLIQDERETGVLTEEMRAGWQACQPILDLGDEVGARMCFLDVYRRRIQEARNTAKKARWTVTLGADPTLRVQRLQEAVEAHRIGSDYARSLLPGPTTVSLDSVAGLLEGPEASPQDRQTASRFRDLAKMLRAGSTEGEQRRMAERQQEREAEAEKKRQIQAQVEAELQKRGIFTVPNDRQEAA
ncbi:MAG: hypothetical protein ACOYMW_16335 [Candidatus Competibacteraceae bacterium]